MSIHSTFLKLLSFKPKVKIKHFFFLFRRTDSFIQQTIRVKFADCTVLTVAHRLNTIIDSDRVLVMDAGKAIEFDTPYNLLNRQHGVFKDMVLALGFREAERLTRMAKENYEAKFIENTVD